LRRLLVSCSQNVELSSTQPKIFFNSEKKASPNFNFLIEFGSCLAPSATSVGAKHFVNVVKQISCCVQAMPWPPLTQGNDITNVHVCVIEWTTIGLAHGHNRSYPLGQSQGAFVVGGGRRRRQGFERIWGHKTNLFVCHVRDRLSRGPKYGALSTYPIGNNNWKLMSCSVSPGIGGTINDSFGTSSNLIHTRIYASLRSVLAINTAPPAGSACTILCNKR